MAVLSQLLFSWGRGPRRVRQLRKGWGPCVSPASAPSRGRAERRPGVPGAGRSAVGPRGPRARSEARGSCRRGVGAGGCGFPGLG